MGDVLVGGLTFPEAPRWLEVPQRPSGLGFRPDVSCASMSTAG